MGFIDGIKTGLKIYYRMSTSKILVKIQDMGVIRGLEIYDRPKIFNCNLYFVTISDVPQQMNISVGGVQLTHISRPLFGAGARTNVR